MKRIFIAAILSLAGVLANAQAKIETKKFKIADFREKTLEVVQTGNSIIDAEMRDAMNKVWHISSFEMCTAEQMEKKKKSTDFYFMVATDAHFDKNTESGLIMLTIYKGDPKAKAGVEGLLELVSIPFCPYGMTDGDETLVLSAILNILQKNAESSVEDNLIATQLVSPTTKKAHKKWTQTILIDKSDLNFELSEADEEIYKTSGILFVGDGEAAAAIESRRPDTLAAYLVISNDESCKYCYMMLIDCDNWDLYYIKKRSISSKSPAGITLDDLSSFKKHRNQDPVLK